jgi:hypothetical protein
VACVRSVALTVEDRHLLVLVSTVTSRAGWCAAYVLRAARVKTPDEKQQASWVRRAGLLGRLHLRLPVPGPASAPSRRVRNLKLLLPVLPRSIDLFVPPVAGTMAVFEQADKVQNRDPAHRARIAVGNDASQCRHGHNILCVAAYLGTLTLGLAALSRLFEVTFHQKQAA